MSAEPVRDLLRVLDLTDTGARTHEDIFTGPSQWSPHGRVFGGQVLAQSVMAATRTVADDRPIHSLHAYFLRPGDVDSPITFSVDRLHDGRSFSTRRTQAYQHGRPILSLIASFQTTDAGVEHFVPAPTGIPEPESLPTITDVLGPIEKHPEAAWALGRPFDIRHIDGSIYLNVDSPRPCQALWFKSTSALPDDPALHRAALAFVSDYTMLEPVMRGHGVSWSTPEIRVASLDHAMWWHRDARADEWILYVQDSPNASGGRGLTLSRMYDRSGRLIASVAQEGMVRIPELRDGHEASE